MSDNRRRFTPEGRAEAVKSVTDMGRPVASNEAAEIGIGAQQLSRLVLQSTKAADKLWQRADRPA